MPEPRTRRGLPPPDARSRRTRLTLTWALRPHHLYTGDIRRQQQLVERGRAVPVLQRDANGDAARWRPVVQGPDIAAMQALVAAMPPVYRAETTTPADMRGQDPTGLVSGAVHALVDAMVLDTLSALRAGSLPADRADRADTAVPLADRLDSYFHFQATIPQRAPAQTSADSVLHQLPAVDLTARGTPLVDLLRPAYLTLGSVDSSTGAEDLPST